jgi:hypothetical protein
LKRCAHCGCTFFVREVREFKEVREIKDFIGDIGFI